MTLKTMLNRTVIHNIQAQINHLNWTRSRLDEIGLRMYLLALKDTHVIKCVIIEKEEEVQCIEITQYKDPTDCWTEEITLGYIYGNKVIEGELKED